MFRRCSLLRVPLSEARQLFIDSVTGKPLATPTASLATVMDALQKHFKDGGEDFTSAAMQHVVQLDRDDDDSQLVAGYFSATSTPSIATSESSSGGSTSTSQSNVHLIVQVMRSFPHTATVRECCCRCLANMCQLPSSFSSSSSSAGTLTVSDELLKEGALEQALGTMSMASRLSRKGRCWAALAVLNLTCLARNGPARAAAAGAEETLSDFIQVVLEDIQSDENSHTPTTSSSSSSSSSPSALRGLSQEQCTALDAALGALAAVLGAEAPDNTKGISFNYEKVTYTAVDATVRALLLASSLLVRDGRNDGAYAASLPSRRYGTVRFVAASPLQQEASIALLPLLHKGWMSLQHITSHSANLPVVFDALYEAANANQEESVSGGHLAEDSEVGGDSTAQPRTMAGDTLEMTPNANRQYVAALSSLVEAALFVVTELEGLEVLSEDGDMGSGPAKLQQDLRLFVMEAMESMTATRRDLSSRQQEAAAQLSATPSPPPLSSDQSHSDGGRREGEDGEEDEGVSAVFPTPAAIGVTGVLASGSVSNMALACVVRLHTDQQQQSEEEGPKGGRRRKSVGESSTGHDAQGVLRPYSADAFTLLSKSLLVLSHLGEAGDDVISSANTVAALHAVLRDAVEVLQTLPSVYKSSLYELFKPTLVSGNGEAVDDATGSSSSSSTIRPSHWLVLMQQAAIIGQLYAVLWSILRTAQGVQTVTEQQLAVLVQTMQSCLEGPYAEAMAQAHETYLPVRDSSEPKMASAGGEEAPALKPSAAEETVVRLRKLGNDLLENMQSLSQASAARAPTP